MSGSCRRPFQGVDKLESVSAYFPVLDQRFATGVYKFYRVFDGNNVVRIILVNVVNHGGHCGGLTGTRGPCHQN